MEHSPQSAVLRQRSKKGHKKRDPLRIPFMRPFNLVQNKINFLVPV